MGSGASDLNAISPVTLHNEIASEHARVKTAHDSIGVVGVCPEEARSTLNEAMAELDKAFDDYHALFVKRAELANPAELVEAALGVNECNTAYQSKKQATVFEVGDVVQVREPEFGLFVEGLVMTILDGKLEVRIEQEAPEDDNELPPTEFVTVTPGTNEVRKVKCWTTLEVGDRVRVKEGTLAFQGVVANISEDGLIHVNFNFEQDNDTHFDEDDDIEYEESEIQSYPRHLVEKVETARLSKLRMKEIVYRVQQSIAVANAFRLGSPRRSISASDS